MSSDDNDLIPREPPTRGLLVCPICQSARVRRVTELAGATLVGLCEACNAEFAVSPQREYRSKGQ